MRSLSTYASAFANSELLSSLNLIKLPLITASATSTSQTPFDLFIDLNNKKFIWEQMLVLFVVSNMSSLQRYNLLIVKCLQHINTKMCLPSELNYPTQYSLT